MELRFRMVLVDDEKGNATVPYLGADAAKADEVYADACQNTKNEAVRMFVYPTAARISRPAAQAAELKHHIESSKAAIAAKGDLAVAKAQAEVDEAEQNLEALQKKHAPILTKKK